MNRRTFLAASSSACAGLALTRTLPAHALAPTPWRCFEVTTRVELLSAHGPSHIWLPAALPRDTPYQRTLSNRFSAPGGTARLEQNKHEALGIVTANYPAGVPPVLTLTSVVLLKNYDVDLSARTPPARAPRAELDYFLQPSRFVPTDGIVKETALKATAGAASDIDKARALYDWVVANTFRNPKIRGCGRGDVRFMLESGDLGGKCADLNALYVALARSVGLPARHVYGLRIAPSERAFRSLGVTANPTRGQHCRAEVYLREHGWVPVDPADVRKVVLEEPTGDRPLSDALVVQARNALFGSWEMNWMAYNYAHDVTLPGSAGKPLVYFMYPQAETAEGRVDPFDPDRFQYGITSRELS